MNNCPSLASRLGKIKEGRIILVKCAKYVELAEWFKGRYCLVKDVEINKGKILDLMVMIDDAMILFLMAVRQF